MFKYYKIWFLFLLLSLILIPQPLQAQSTDQPMVYGIFFYAPTCQYSTMVFTEYWPAIQDEFGDQFKVIYVDTSTPTGQAIFNQVQAVVSIEYQATPTLVIGDTVLIGGYEIPEKAPTIVRAGLAQGGTTTPNFPGASILFDYGPTTWTVVEDGTQTKSNPITPLERLMEIVRKWMDIPA